jgi:hypothetical protein
MFEIFMRYAHYIGNLILLLIYEEVRGADGKFDSLADIRSDTVTRVNGVELTWSMNNSLPLTSYLDEDSFESEMVGWNPPVDVVVTQKVVAQYYDAQVCDLRAGSTYNAVNLGFIMSPDNFANLTEVSVNISQMEYDGRLSSFQQSWITPKNPECSIHSLTDGLDPAGLYGLYFLYAAGIAFTTIYLLYALKRAHFVFKTAIEKISADPDPQEVLLMEQARPADRQIGERWPDGVKGVDMLENSFQCLTNRLEYLLADSFFDQQNR